MMNSSGITTKTNEDLQKIIDQWHHQLIENENRLVQHAISFDKQQEFLNETTAAFVENEQFLREIDRDLEEFHLNVELLKKHNDELEKSIEQVNGESKTYLPTFLTNVKTEQERNATFESLESVDANLNDLEKQMSRLEEFFQINTDRSIIKTMDELLTVSKEIDQLQRSIKQMKFDEK